MKHVITFSFLIFLTGCAVQVKVTSPDNFSISTPQLDTKQESEIGISLVSKEVGYKYKALRILKYTKIKTGCAGAIRTILPTASQCRRKCFGAIQRPYQSIDNCS